MAFKLSLLLSLCLVGFLRFYHLGDFPAGLTKDESYYGYDAYSILLTGQDIWGEKYPLFFKSTGEYKLGLTYLIVPAVKFLGLTETAVRLPSAVFGFATLAVLYATLQKLFGRRILSLLGTVIFALSPWAFGISRLFFESNVGLFFIAAGLYGLLLRRTLTASVLLALAGYLYNPYRYLGLALLVVGLLFSRVKSRTSLKALTVFFLVMLPLLVKSPPGSVTKRLGQEWLLRQNDYAMVSNDMRAKCQLHLGSPLLAKLCYPLWNKPILHLGRVASVSVRTLSPEFLFEDAGNKYLIPESYGMYLNFLLPFYLLGLCWLLGFVRLVSPPPFARPLILTGILISTFMLATPGVLEAYRSPVPMYLLFLVMMAGFALAHSLSLRLPRVLRLTAIGLILVIGLSQQAKYLLSYRLSSPSLPLLFSADTREIFTFLESRRDYRYIVDKKFHGPITAAYFWRLDPQYFQDHIVWTDPDPWGFINAYQLDNLYSQRYSVESLLCQKHRHPREPIRAVVIDDPGKYASFASLRTYDYSGSLNLHAVYDIDELYPQILQYFPADLCTP